MSSILLFGWQMLTERGCTVFNIDELLAVVQSRQEGASAVRARATAFTPIHSLPSTHPLLPHTP
jgi:hypothetical protein